MRDTVARYVEQHEAKDVVEAMRQLWCGSLEVTTIVPDPARPPPAFSNRTEAVERALAGHELGSVPDECVVMDEVPGYPDTAATTRGSVRKRVDMEALAANLVRHTKTLGEMRSIDDQEYKTNNIVASHVLSSSCRFSGRLLRWFPTTKFFRLSNSRMQQLLRLRLGIPTVHPLVRWRCDCSDADAVNVPALLERIAPDEVLTGVCLRAEPCHALSCRKRWRRVVKRHDNVRDVLYRWLNALPHVAASWEPRVDVNGNPYRRVDVSAEFGGKTWQIDVRFACPATRSRVDTRHTDTKPGAAARLAYGDKVRAYRGIQHALVGELLPFVVETGGRLAAKSIRSLKELVGGAVREQMTRGSLENVGDVEAEVEAQCATLCRRIGDEVAKSACYMMAGLIGDLMKVRQRRMMQHQLQAADPHGGGGDP
jgi:hypothetical protein